MKWFDRNTQEIIIFGVAATGTALLVGWFVKRRMRENSFKVVGHVTSLHCYPVKSCQGITKETALCTSKGIEFDRNWVIIDREDRFITQRSHPKLALIRVDLNDETITLSTEGKQPLTLSIIKSNRKDLLKKEIDVFGVSGEGVHVDDRADQWLAEYFGKEGFKLFQFIASCRPRFVSTEKTFGSDARSHDVVAFPDLCPYLLISEASLSHLNSHLEERIDMRRFRPNIVISGCHAYEEDQWKTIRIGKVEFRGLHRCGRCILPTVDPETGVLDSNKEPLKTLRKIRLVPKAEDPRYGLSPIFGRNLACDQPGTVAIGDAVYASCTW